MKNFSSIQIIFSILLLIVLVVPFVNFKSLYVSSSEKCVPSKAEFYKSKKNLKLDEATKKAEALCKKFEKSNGLFYNAPTFNNFTYYSWLVLGVLGTGVYLISKKTKS